MRLGLSLSLSEREGALLFYSIEGHEFSAGPQVRLVMVRFAGEVSEGAPIDSSIGDDVTVRLIPVLIVEPSGFYAKHMASLLTPHGCHCDIVQTAAAAKVSLSRSEYDMACISRRLDDGTGPGLARFIRREPGMARIPLVMVTAEDSREAFQEAYTAGFTEVFFRGELERLAKYLEFFANSREEDRRLVGRVLYLEDTKWLASVTIATLHGVGLSVDHFTAVTPALESFSKRNYDIIITDIVLEGAKSGLSLVQEIRAMEGARASVPILATTGIEDATRRIELFRAGVSDYISKPVMTEELVARVSNLIINKQLLETVGRQQDQLMRMATIDSLTGLYNRRHLTSLAAAALANAQANHEEISIILIDLDFFKKVNDELGHQMGDVVLRVVGHVLGQFAEEKGLTAARFGGEEFLMLLERVDWQQTIVHAEELRGRIEKSRPDGHKITASFGVSTLGPQDTYYELFERADQALYKAKEQGRNRVSLCRGP